MKAVKMPQTVSGVKKGLTGLVKQTFEKAAEQPAQAVDEVVSGVLGGPKAKPKPKADSALSARLNRAQKTQDLEEINRIRAEIGQDGPQAVSGGRNVEKEIAQVRAEKKRLQDAKEEEFLRQLAEQKKQEEEAMSADAYYEPPGKKKRGSAFARNIKRSSGTKEMGKGAKN